MGLLGQELPELDGDLGSNFETAQANSRPDRCNQICWLRFEHLLHERHSPATDPGGGSPPARVNSGYRSLHRIDEQDRKTIGGSDRCQAWKVGHDPVSFAERARPSISIEYDVGMNLPDGGGLAFG